MAGELRITNGPSKFDLMVSLFEGNRTPRHTVGFELDGEGRRMLGVPGLTVAVIGVEQEDGSGESWIFKGYCVEMPNSPRVRGYFRTSNREGWIRFEN